MSKGWFKTPGYDGERTVAEQMRGLEYTLDAIKPSDTVLDAGCAEGHIARAVAERTQFVDACDINKEMLAVAKGVCKGTRVRIYHHDFNNAWPGTFVRYDVILALAIIHKVHDPRRLLLDFAERTSHRLVIRLPVGSHGQIINKHGALKRPCDINAELTARNFVLSHQCEGPRTELVQHWTRC